MWSRQRDGGDPRWRRAAGQLAWVRADDEGPQSRPHPVALGTDLLAGEVRTCRATVSP